MHEEPRSDCPLGLTANYAAAQATKCARAMGCTLALVLLVVSMSACGRASGAAAGPRATVPPTPTGVAKWTQAARAFPPPLTPIEGRLLPAFADWRAAYLGSDGVVYAVTLDGTTDLAGPQLPGMDSYGLAFASAGIAPNGHVLVYATNSFSIVDVAGRQPVTSDAGAYAYSVALSPDGRKALFTSRPFQGNPFTPTADVIDTATGAVRALPQIAPLTAGMFFTFAWRPGSHTVAVTTNQ